MTIAWTNYITPCLLCNAKSALGYGIVVVFVSLDLRSFYLYVVVRTRGVLKFGYLDLWIIPSPALLVPVSHERKRGAASYFLARFPHLLCHMSPKLVGLQLSWEIVATAFRTKTSSEFTPGKPVLEPSWMVYFHIF